MFSLLMTLSVGDVFQEKCERRIQSFIDSGNVTVLFVSHSIDQVERLCKSCVWIEKGKQRMVGPVEKSARPTETSSTSTALQWIP